MTRIEELAQRLLREGHVDNDADARLAALHILLAVGAGRTTPKDRTRPAAEQT
jgi:hypothetical protein